MGSFCSHVVKEAEYIHRLRAVVSLPAFRAFIKTSDSIQKHWLRLPLDVTGEDIRAYQRLNELRRTFYFEVIKSAEFLAFYEYGRHNHPTHLSVFNWLVAQRLGPVTSE